jgi:hypothetical protein
MNEGAVLFGGKLPDTDVQNYYSHAWGGMFAGQDFLKLA